MADRVLVYDDIADECDLRTIVPYTRVTSNDNSATVTQTFAANGQPVYDVSVVGGVDTFGIPSVATVAGNDFFGTAYAVGAAIVTYPGGVVARPVGGGAGSTSSLQENADGTYTHNDGEGNTEVIDFTGNAQLGVENTGTARNPVYEMDIDSLPAVVVDEVCNSGTRQVPIDIDGEDKRFDLYNEASQTWMLSNPVDVLSDLTMNTKNEVTVIDLTTLSTPPPCGANAVLVRCIARAANDLSLIHI